jgi:hypothetical protein
MSYGYLGDTSTSIKQQVKNQGILSPSDVVDLESKGHLGGSLELIEEQTISSNVSSVDFTSIQQNKYEVHRLDIINAKSDTDNKDFALRVSTGGTFQTGSVYHRALYTINSSGTTAESRATTASQMDITQNSGNATNEKSNSIIYIYNAGNSSLFTLNSSHSTYMDNGSAFKTSFGGGAYDVANEVDGFRIFMDGSGNIASGIFRLFGVKQI